jgi:hypothetical protein
MTRDDIIRMAREACDPDKVEAWSNGFWTITQEELERFAFLVAKAERKGDDMKQLIECSTCGYPLTPGERTGLVEIDGKMCKPQAPDAWRTEARNEHGLPVFFCASEVKQAGPGLIPLYTAPPLLQRKPLTDEEISSLISTSPPSFAVEIVRIIERAHGIGSEE